MCEEFADFTRVKRAKERVIVRFTLGSYRHFVALSFAALCAVSGCGNLIGLGEYSVADHGDDGGAGLRNGGAGGSVGRAAISGGTGASAGAENGEGGAIGGAPDDNVAGTAGEGGAIESGGSGGTGALSGTSGTSGASGTSGTAGTGGAPALCPGGCDDGNDCTSDSCKSGTCVHEPLALGAACGVSRTCDAQAVCVRCRDTAAGTGQDVGCSPAAPVCLGTGLDAACAGCSAPSDCNDGNDCTSESCIGGKCEFTSVAAGVACSTGVCNGTASAEKCVACADTSLGGAQDAGCSSAKPVCDVSGTATCYECNSGSDCATDNVSCTVETCTNHVCSHAATDSLCSASGDVCKPNKCDAALGCKQVDVTSNRVLIGTSSSQGNGGFEDSAGAGSAVGWSNVGTFKMVFDCNPAGAGCAGSNGKTVTGTGGANYLAWLGGTQSTSITGIDHLIVLPAGTVKLQVIADMNFQTASAAAANKDLFEIRLLNSAKGQVGQALYAASNANAQTGTARAWTINGINATVDVSAYVTAHPGEDSYISFWSSVDNSQQTDFFIDNVRVNATVCQ